MSSREDIGSWLEGTPRGSGGRVSGLPPSGRGSLAPVGRRVAALGVDWFASMLISAAFFPSRTAPVGGVLAGDPTATLAIFALSTVVLVSLVGHTLGHRLLGLRVVPLTRDGPPATGPRAPGVRAGLVRLLLLLLVIPAVVWDSAGRGMHDVAARTAIVRR